MLKSGNVGIGTTAPGVKLEVSDSGSTTIRIKPLSGTNNLVSNLDFWGTFYNYPADTGTRRVGNIQTGFSTGTWGTEYMAFGLGSDDAAALPTERMRITGSGNVGIGTTNPLAKLHVNGSIRGTPDYFVQSYTSDRTCTATAGSWVDFTSTSITITGQVGDIFVVTLDGVFIPANTGYNHDRYACASGCTILVDGQPGGYYTSTAGSMSTTLLGLVKLTSTTAVVKIQHYNGTSGGTNSIKAGTGGNGSAPLNIIAWRLN
jgi:hypothetical protein